MRGKLGVSRLCRLRLSHTKHTDAPDRLAVGMGGCADNMQSVRHFPPEVLGTEPRVLHVWKPNLGPQEVQLALLTNKLPLHPEPRVFHMLDKNSPLSYTPCPTTQIIKIF